MNNSFEEIAQKITEADSIYLFPHERPDGDAIGSTAALCSMLRDMGKKCYVLIQERLPENLEFMDDDMFFIPEEGIAPADVSIAVDCSEISRFPGTSNVYKMSPLSIAIDHHINNDPCGDLNYVDPDTAATGELIFRLMRVMDHMPSKREAEDIFAAIVTDTGNFLYSNTTKTTHRIVCELYDSGIDVGSVSAELYENESPQKVRIIENAMNTMKVYGDGKVATAYVTQEMLEDAGAVMSDTDPVINNIRAMAGVEVAIVFKEYPENKTAVSLRAKKYADVSKLATQFGGGGHVKAAGCTVYEPIGKAMEMVIDAAVKMLKEE